MTHPCTQSQYQALGPLLGAQGLTFTGTVPEPDTAGYPDLSAYIGLVFSSDELHALWVSYGLEK